MIYNNNKMASFQSQPEKIGGFDCEFVEPPPDVLQSECPVCLLVICDPYQVTCCGYSYCRLCIERIKIDNIPCPTCKEKSFSDYPNKGLKRSLYAFKVRCSHQKDGCEWTGELGQFDVHLNTNPLPDKLYDGCPLTTISCDFLHVGCEVKLPRKDMPEHTRESFLQHMSLLATSHNLQQAQINSLVDENKHLKQEISALSQAMMSKGTASVATKPVLSRSMIPIVPSPTLTITNFHQHKLDGDWWYSTPVYTHHQGYKICLGVVANGDGPGKGTHVSVHVYFMRGEFDDSLRWPFRGVISFRLYNQLTNYDHKAHLSIYDDSVENKNCDRVRYGERANSGWGAPMFIAQSVLEPKYLQDDTLKFQVCSGEAHI